jgi:hypothetical protein
MLSRVDRVQLVVPDRKAAVERWLAFFAAEQVGEDGSEFLNAHRTTVQAGESLFEFLEPAGPGPVQEFRERWGQGLYGVGFSTPNLLDAQRHFNSYNVKYTEERGQLFLALDETFGVPTTIVEDTARARVGVINFVYEVTNPVADWQDAAAAYTRVFKLDPARFSPIHSGLYAYDGTLTLFDPPARLDRIEITQTHGGGAMHRFYEKRGPSLYMCYIETDDVLALAERLRKNNARFSEGEERLAEVGLFIHPTALFGMLMGVSVKDYAWSWSGRPELVPAKYPPRLAH